MGCCRLRNHRNCKRGFRRSSLVRYHVTLWQVALIYLGISLTAAITLGMLQPTLVTRLGRVSAAIVICVIGILGVTVVTQPDLPLRWLLGGALVAGVVVGPFYAWAYGPLEDSNDDPSS